MRRERERTARRAARAALALGLALAACGGNDAPGAAATPQACGCAGDEVCIGGRCVANPTCEPPPPSASAAQPPLEVLRLGTHAVGTAVSFALPPGAAGFTLVQQAVSAPALATFTDAGAIPNAVVPLQIADPAGTIVFESFTADPDPTRALLHHRSFSPGTGTLTFPNTSAALQAVRAGLPAGTWSFVVSDLAHACTLATNCASGSAASTYDVTVIVKPGAGAQPVAPAGRLDLTFHLAPSGLVPELDAAAAPADPALQRMVGTLALLLARAGVAPGAVRYADVPAELGTRIAAGLDVDDPTACGELPLLLRTAPPGRQLNVFLISTFVASGLPPGTRIAGMDGAIPGPATVSPAPQSGVVVGVADLRAGTCTAPAPSPFCGADAVAYVVAHEIGHFLGLYHTTEADGASFDPLSDTPACPCAACSTDPARCAGASPAPASPHRMTRTECRGGSGCGGADNLMFWLFDPRSPGELTGEQQQVLRANPAVYPEPP